MHRPNNKKGLTGVQPGQAETDIPTAMKGSSISMLSRTNDRRLLRLTIDLGSKVALTILVAGLGWLAMSSLVDELLLGVVLWGALAIGWRRAIVRERRAARIARLWALRAHATVEALHVELGEEVAA